jgi:ubiquinone/menaquinone biosynthesis C-methylase UbiE
MSVEKDQHKFFNQYASQAPQGPRVTDLFSDLAVREIRDGFRWLSSCESVLDYGCGIGQMFELFCETIGRQPQRLVGIDLSEVSIEVAKRRLPYEFHVVPDNDLSFLPAGSLDGVYMIFVLHHAEHHERIFETIARVLKPGGKFLLVDLTKTNPIIETARGAFPYMPKRIKGMFPEDLVIDGTIPEKLNVDVDQTLASLDKAGFDVQHIDYGHLYFFVFDWLERALGMRLSKTRFSKVYLWFYAIERRLLKARFVARHAHLFALQAVKRPA